ncbi:MAG TPA: LLM class flavin-dependent oxidoreductase [Xanthobacteraceae bacterium]|jgi:5,10-methylenetetrahydromethanopterin reductase
MAPPLLISVSVDGSDPPASLRALVEAAEAAGAANLWLAAHLFNREPIVSGAAALAASRNLGIVLMAISPYTVHPVYAAMAAATLDELFPGRVQLCFGVGAPAALEAAGLAAEHPVETLREALDVTRLLLSGESVRFAGRRYRISGRLAMGPHRLPLWLAASGPRMLELAGEKADGVVVSAGTSPAFIGWCLQIVRRGEERGGRTIRKAALVVCSVDAHAPRAHERVRRRLAYILRGAHHARNLKLARSRLDQTALAEAMAQENWGRVDALMTDDLVMRHCASGTPDQVRGTLETYRDAGLDEIVAYGMHGRSELQEVLAMVRPPPQSMGR